MMFSQILKLKVISAVFATSFTVFPAISYACTSCTPSSHCGPSATESACITQPNGRCYTNPFQCAGRMAANEKCTGKVEDISHESRKDSQPSILQS